MLFRSPAFAGFYGMEDTIERLVGFFRHAAQGLEERKQILYLLGPVGGGKSSLAERIKALMFTFDDLIKLDSASAQTLMRNIDKDKLGVALTEEDLLSCDTVGELEDAILAKVPAAPSNP